MTRSVRAAASLVALLALGYGTVSAVWAQSSIEMEMLRDRIDTDKKNIIAANLDLTDDEAETFWPIYDEFQIEIDQINSRIGWLIRDFGAAYNSDAISDDQAQELLDEAIAIDADEADMRRKYARQMRRVIPAAELVRYFQMENKIRAVIRFDLAANIPLAE